MLRARAVCENRARVRGRDVADVGREPVAGIEGVEPPHQAVARDLRDDRRGGDGRALRVAVDDAGCGGASGPSRKPSTRQASAGG